MRKILIGVVLLSAVFVPVSNAEVLADSITDFSDTQGGNGWTYEVYNYSNGAFYDIIDVGRTELCFLTV